MTRLKTQFARLRAYHHAIAGVIAAISLVLGAMALTNQAVRESNARRSPQTLAFERAREDGLTRQTSASALRKAMDTGKPAAVSLAATPSGLVLYTLHDGEGASLNLPAAPRPVVPAPARQ